MRPLTFSPTTKHRTSASHLALATVLTLAFAVVGPTAGIDAVELDPQELPSVDHPRLKPRIEFGKSLERALGEDRDPRVVIVKLKEAGRKPVADHWAEKPSADAQLEASTRAAEQGVAAMRSLIGDVPGVEVAPLFALPKFLLDVMRRQGEARTGEELADLSTFFVVHSDASEVGETLVRELIDSPSIETIYAHQRSSEPVDIPPTTPLFTVPVSAQIPGQLYLQPAPLGVDAAAAWQRGYVGTGVTIADIERNWNLDHEDLDHLPATVAVVPRNEWLDPGCPNPPLMCPAPIDIDHGTATLGVLASGVNAYGTTGMAPGASIRVVPTNRVGMPTWIAPNAVALAMLNLTAGDVILIEAQKPILGTLNNVPFENDDAEFAVVRQATALGIHVIEPVGNSPGGLNLDSDMNLLDPRTGTSRFDRYFRDSGAVLVGAGDSQTDGTPGQPRFHRRYCNSNFGSKVDTYAWGRDVATLGYGPRTAGPFCFFPTNLFPAAPDLNQNYTNCWSGTSSAGAIIAGVATALEDKHRTDFGQPFTVAELRNHLSLGTWSAISAPGCSRIAGGVGHQPDLDYAIDFIDQGGLIRSLYEAPVSPGTFPGRFGWSVDGLGDITGDSVPELAVGEPERTIPGRGGPIGNAGRVYVFDGATGDLFWSMDGVNANDFFGFAVAGLGDVDFNGVPDLAVGIPGDDSVAADAGAVQIFLMDPDPVNIAAMPPTFGAVAGERYGAAVAPIGNVNPTVDPFPDVLIGAPADPSSFGLTGRVEIVTWYGTVIRSVPGTQGGAEFGFSLADVGDVDGDNRPDFVVGEPSLDTSLGSDVGAVHIVSGATGSTLVTRQGDLPSGLSGPVRYGHSVDNAGDVIGNGANEIVVGAPASRVAPAGFHGRADLLDLAGNRLWFFDGINPRENLGTSVAGLGDFNGDGFDDFAIGSPETLGTFLNSDNGKVRVILGGQTPSDFGERIFWTKDDNTRWGWSVAAAGDVNGDGLADVATGEPDTGDGGRAFVFTLGPGADPRTGLATLVADLGIIEAHDVNGDCNGGGGLSPSTSDLLLDAGPAWGGADYAVLGLPDVGAALTNAMGQLDANGRTTITIPSFGPFPSRQACAAVGYRHTFVGVALRDLDGDGQWDIFQLSNTTEVEIVNEYFPLCQPGPTCP